MFLIKPFSAAQQPAARALILRGLGEHWGFIDESLNPDLTDIAQTFSAGCFLVGVDGETLIATGAYLPFGNPRAHAMQISRMSVSREHRRGGLGTAMLEALLDHARAAGYRQAVLETTETWHEVIAFYLRNGFEVTHRADGDVWFQRAL